MSQAVLRPFDKKMSMGSVPNCPKEIANRYGIRWFKCKLKPPKNQALIQYFPELFYDEPIIILLSDKQRVLEITDFLSQSGYPSVYCHEGCTSEQNAYAWQCYNEAKSSILAASLKSDAFYSFYEISYQGILLVDFSTSVQRYDDLVEILEHRQLPSFLRMMNIYFQT